MKICDSVYLCLKLWWKVVINFLEKTNYECGSQDFLKNFEFPNRLCPSAETRVPKCSIWECSNSTRAWSRAELEGWYPMIVGETPNQGGGWSLYNLGPIVKVHFGDLVSLLGPRPLPNYVFHFKPTSKIV